MAASHYVQLTYPWKAAVDARRRAPALFLASLIEQSLRYGMPSTRRFGSQLAFIGRRGLPRRSLATLLRWLPRKDRDDIEELLVELKITWPELADRSEHLSPEAPELTTLTLERASATTVFVFGETDDPILVCKLPRTDPAEIEMEAGALLEASSSGTAPAYLGVVGRAHVQEAVKGAPLKVRPITPADGAAIAWSADHDRLAAALDRLSAATSKRHVADELADGEVQRVMESDLVGPRTKGKVSAALAGLSEWKTSVLKHADTSPQNCLLHADEVRLVDWANARTFGMPGFDCYNAALSFLDHGLGLVRWSDERSLELFRTVLREGTYWDHARAAGASCVLSAGGNDDHATQSEIAFFARRLALRIAGPDRFLLGAPAAARMLDLVCER